MMGLRPALNQLIEEAKVELSGEFVQAEFSSGPTKQTGKHPLHKYTLPNGTILYEKVQATIIVPDYIPSLLVFTSLRWEEKWLSEESLWTLEEIAHVCRKPLMIPPVEWAKGPT